ncbi:MAG: hypothetical protein O7J95_21840 [Planctomycetota bacterium]|nr:hypothetical protein [Planctomycetota bacterium]
MNPIKTYRLSALWYRALCVERLPRQLIEPWVRRPRELLAAARDPVPKASCFLAEISPEVSPVFVKRHRRSGWKTVADQLSGRPTRARRGFDVGLALERARVHAARPLAAIERRLPGESYLLLDRVTGLDLRCYLEEKLPRISGESEQQRFKAELWQVLGETIARFHAAKVRQPDLKAPNIMVDDSGEVPRAVLVDLEGMHALSRLPTPKQRARDLGRLAVSLRAPALRRAGVEPADWEMLLQHYLEASRAAFPVSGDLHDWLGATLDWARRKEAPLVRRGQEIY